MIPCTYIYLAWLCFTVGTIRRWPGFDSPIESLYFARCFFNSLALTVFLFFLLFFP
ncbi:hypothetical protein F5B21DRAFT_488684 [Xylaria acuta]|nr:hypothetical protein F5B21DRAFT_488684 [Xylaria acuta]